MNFSEQDVTILSMAPVLLLFLLNMSQSLALCAAVEEDKPEPEDYVVAPAQAEGLSAHLNVATHATLHHLRLFSMFATIDDDLGYWVKPRSTTWFSRFLVHEYDDYRWIQMFRMTKRELFTLTQLLANTVKKKDTKYRLAVPVTVRVACTLFKLCHGASLLICSEMFAVGRSTVSAMLRDVVHAVNVDLRGEINWPDGASLPSIAAAFQEMCGLPGVVGAVDGTHISITKPRVASADYYYFKTSGYSINCQAVVDASKKFMDVYVGMPGSTNDVRMLRRSTLFNCGQRNILWPDNLSFAGFSPFLLGDGGYPLLPWIMVPHRRTHALSMSEALFNRKLSKGRVVVENAFGILKMSFRELNRKSDLHVSFLPDVVTCCAILHNVLLNQSEDEVERLLQILRSERRDDDVHQETVVVDEGRDAIGADADHALGQVTRQRLGVFLCQQRVVPL